MAPVPQRQLLNDRLKEVPNRLLSRWAAARREHGGLTLDELLEIAQLSDAQLDAADMAEGARDCWGLAEWDVARGRFQRPHRRFLAQLAPAQRQEALSAAGLAFSRMSLAQQQQFLTLRDEPRVQSLEELAGAMLRVVYTLGNSTTGLREVAVQVTHDNVRMWGHDYPAERGDPARAG